VVFHSFLYVYQRVNGLLRIGTQPIIEPLWRIFHGSNDVYCSLFNEG
jgi:hypothetical protein